MKRKFSMFLNIAMLAICVCAIAFGVYSAKQANLNVTGTIGFKAHDCEVDISASIYGHANGDDPLGEPVLKEDAEPLNGGSVLQITGADKALSFGIRYFSDLGESGEVEPIYIELTITNKSQFEVLIEDLTTTSEDASYTAVCTNPLHVLYTDEDKTTTLQYVLRPAKVDGEYQEISSPVNISLSMKFSKLNTNISSENYSFSGTTITGVPTYEQTGSDLIVIPSKFSDNETIFNMLGFALENLYDYTKVVILNGITSIGEGAINSMENMVSIALPSSVTSIGESAFMDCISLTNILLPSGVTSIGDGAFSGCSGLTSIVVDSENTKYDSRNNCNAIIEKETNTLIAGCEATVIPNSVEIIGDSAFNGCSGLTSITIPSSVNSIGNHAFSGCSSLTSITIPSSVTSIVGYAFYYCTSLSSITIPSSVETIGDSAFYGCSGLTSITIPSSVTSIGGFAFQYCTSLTSIVVDSKNETYDSRYNCNAIIEKTSNTLIAGCKTTVIPNTVTSIGDYAFLGCSGLTSITIPSSVTSIGSYAFNHCTKLTSVTFESTTGWYVGSSAGDKATAIDQSKLANTSTAATYLKSTYYNKYWTRG